MQSTNFFIIIAITATNQVQGLFMLKSGLQKIVRMNAVVSSVVDSMQVGLVSDRLIDDVVNIHINKLDILYLGLFAGFLFSQLMLMKQVRYEKLSNISSYSSTKKWVNQLLFVLYFILMKGVDNAI